MVYKWLKTKIKNITYFEMKTIESFLIVISLFLGFCQVWTNRYDVGADIISYLDMSDAISRGDWSTFRHGLLFWPPFYSCVLGFFLAILKPSPFLEYPVVQFVNYLIFVLTLAAFRFFLKEFRLCRAFLGAKSASPERVTLSEPSCTIVAYALFIWSSVELIGVSLTNPDMTLAAFLYVAFGLLLKIARDNEKKVTFALFGLTLGFGYLTKAVMFPLSFVFLVVLSCLMGRRGLSRVLLAFVAFCVVSGPLVCLISVTKGQFTFSEQGSLNYAWNVNGVNYSTHWHGESPSRGKPVHPTRKLHDVPEVYEFAEPINATYPPWYDPPYWYEGLENYFDLTNLMKATIRHSKKIGEVFLFGMNGMIVAAIFLSVWMAPKRCLVHQDILKYWFLFVPAIAALGMYSIVHVEPRYIGLFVVIISLILISGSQNYNIVLSKGMAILMLAMCLLVTFPKSSKVILDVARGRDKAINISWEIANKLHGLGLRQGDWVASVSYSGMDIARWAHLARVRIVAEVPYFPGRDESFWNASPEVRREIIKLFEKTSAVLIISNEKPKGSVMDGWEKLGITGHTNQYATDYYAYLFPVIRERATSGKTGD